jgi:hypothetical protein
VRPPEAFMSLRDVQRDNFDIRPARYASWVEQWLPTQQRLHRSFALCTADRAPGMAATPLVDRELYLTLSEAHRGLGRAGWSRSATRRITRFVDRLQRLYGGVGPIADLRIRNVVTDLDDKFEVHREPPRFNL